MVTTIVVVDGMVVIAVGKMAINISMVIAKFVDAWILLMWRKRPRKVVKAYVEVLILPRMVTVMMTIIIAVATGTTVIAVVRRKSTKHRIVPSASAKIATLTSKSARKKTLNAETTTGKATEDATTITTTAHAIGTAATAVVRKTATSIAKSASVWILKTKNALDCVDHRIGPMMVSATTIITIVVVDGIRETAVAIPGIKTSTSSVKSASVWIPKANTMHRKLRHAAALARTRTGRATVFATLGTTTAPVSTTKAIAVAIRAKKTSSNSAKLKSANA